MKIRLKAISAVLCACLVLTGCSGGVSSVDDEPVLEDRLMLSFTPADSLESVGTNSNAVVMNYLYYLSRGEYDTALEFCSIPDGVLFDDIALQKAVLADGIGRGESIAFYDISSDEAYSTVEYDLTSSGQVGTVVKDIYVVQGADGLYRIDLEASDYVAQGNLDFQVPKYVQAYINDVYIPQDKYLDANYQYHITRGVAKIPSNDVIVEYDEDGNEIESTAAPANLVLTLKTKFGVEQSYPLSFEGSLEKDKTSVNDTYWSDREGITDFKIAVPRLTREQALKYISETVMPTLYKDIVNANSWESASIRSEFRTDSNTGAVEPLYFKTSTGFSNARLDTDGGYFFQDVSLYNFEMTDALADRYSGSIEITDYNKLEVFFTFNYNYKYSKGAGGDVRMFEGDARGSITLSIDDDDKWYVNDISSDLFKISTP